jgi:hypothetical protein
MNAIAEFLYPTPAPRRFGGILRWWESRRLQYNAIVGTSGLVSLAAFQVLTGLPPDPHHVPLFWAPIVAFGLMANVCYFLGPAVELAVEKLWGGKVLPTGPALFRMGLTFSVGLTLLPTLLAGMDWAFRIFRWLF